LTAGEQNKEYFNSKRTEAWNALKVVEQNNKSKEYLESRRIEAENTGLKQEKHRMPCQQENRRTQANNMDSRRTEAKNTGVKQENKRMECLASRKTEGQKQRI
jgi:hypothetical protein